MLVRQKKKVLRYHMSNGKSVLCDLQGGRDSAGSYVLSDVVICSEVGSYGATDLGIQGVKNFMNFHQCNEFCSRNWLRCNDARAFFHPTL